jgi:hypothetical protein
MSKVSLIAGGLIFLAVLLGGAFGGWQAHKILRPCPIITSDTVTIHDTITYTVYDSIPVLKVDTVWVPTPVEIPAVVDTAAILKNYFTVLDYTWSKADTNLTWDLTTRVTQNRPVSYRLDYKILRPQTIINNVVDNTITYNKYVYAGLGLPITKTPFNSVSIEGIYAFPKGFVGLEYQPITNITSVKAGITIFKFKK